MTSQRRTLPALAIPLSAAHASLHVQGEYFSGLWSVRLEPREELVP